MWVCVSRHITHTCVWVCVTHMCLGLCVKTYHTHMI